MTDEKIWAFADGLQRSCRYCAAMSYVDGGRLFEQPIPDHTDLTATVSFISFRERTYAITARHVVTDFRVSVADPARYTFFVPKAPGHTIQDRFYLPPAGLIGREPDIAVTKIHSGLPGYLGKESFVLADDLQPQNFTYALAVGYPTGRKTKTTVPGGWQLAMECCHAVAQGVSTGIGDQVQFYSEVDISPKVASLSGMSGGPAFWSDGEAFGLIGIVKQAMSNITGPDQLGGGPKVHFVCQRFSSDDFANWVSMLD